MHTSSHAENGSDAVWGEDFCRRAVCLKMTVAQYQKAVGTAGRELKIVEDRQDGAPGIHERRHLLHERKLVVHVEVSGRLVEQQEIGLLHQCLRQKHTLGLPPTQRQHRAGLKSFQVDLRQGTGHAIAVGRPVGLKPAPVRRASQQDQFFDGEIERERAGLPYKRQAARPLRGRPVANLPPVQLHRAAERDVSPEGAEEGRLAAAIRPDQTNPGARRNLEPHVGEDLLSAQVNLKLVDVKKGHVVHWAFRNRAKNEPAPTPEVHLRPPKDPAARCASSSARHLMDFSQRARAREWMDDLSVTDERLRDALTNLRWINRWLGGYRASRVALAPLLHSHPRLHILDVGSGGADYLPQFVHWGESARCVVRATGLDLNPVTVGHGRAWLDAVLPPEQRSQARLEIGDALDLPYPDDAFDVAHAALFLHHLYGSEAHTLLREMQRVSRFGIVVNDLHRHPVAYAGIWALSRLGSFSPMVQHDGPLSVRRGFHRSDLVSLAATAGLPAPQIRWHWAFRWTLSTL